MGQGIIEKCIKIIQKHILCLLLIDDDDTGSVLAFSKKLTEATAIC